MRIDPTDKKILKALQENGRISNQDLADKVGLSPSASLRRLKALEDANIITGYQALLNTKALGLSLTALIHISMDKHTPERFSHFEKEIAKIPEVQELLIITGQQADFQLRVIVTDMDSYHELLLKRITSIESVTGVHTSFVLQQTIYKNLVAIGSL
jgi:Lrp/AsnC family leucine-responsive transcriptional regulator